MRALILDFLVEIISNMIIASVFERCETPICKIKLSLQNLGDIREAKDNKETYKLLHCKSKYTYNTNRKKNFKI